MGSNKFQTQEKNEHLRVDFATKAQAFSAFIKDHSHRIESLHGEIQHQIYQLHVMTGEVAAGRSQYEELVRLTHELDAAQVSENLQADSDAKISKSLKPRP